LELAASGFPFDSRFPRWQGVRSILTGIGCIEAIHFKTFEEKLLEDYG